MQLCANLSFSDSRFWVLSTRCWTKEKVAKRDHCPRSLTWNPSVAWARARNPQWVLWNPLLARCLCNGTYGNTHGETSPGPTNDPGFLYSVSFKGTCEACQKGASPLNICLQLKHITRLPVTENDWHWPAFISFATQELTQTVRRCLLPRKPVLIKDVLQMSLLLEETTFRFNPYHGGDLSKSK